MIRPLIGGLCDGSGFAGGVQFFKTINGAELQATARISNRLYQGYDVSLVKEFSFLKTGPAAFFQSRPQEEYFGEGPHTTDSNRSNYLFREGRIGWLTNADLRVVTLRHAFHFRETVVGEGTDTQFPTTQSLFPEVQVEGGFVDTRWLVNEFGITFDVRDERDNFYDRRSGFHFDAALLVNHGIGATESRFNTLRLINFFYIPLSQHRYHLIAVRSELIHNISNDPIPFYLQPTLGGSAMLRGYREQRFRDRDSFATSIEYRYKIWDYMDAIVFGDAGQVYSNVFDEIGDHRLHSAIGVGLRVNSRLVNFRLTFGRGSEGTRTFLKAGQPLW
ncbi:MAG: BamA/TamA family outer membrane protein [Acidobacteria bacterium]|nr:BamA/TamA family outer membrane protein [Acidobacteriota bacterium]